MDDLVVKVGADITGFLSKIDQAKARVNQLTEEQGQLKAVVQDLNTSLRLNERELTAATVKLQKLNVTTAQGKKEAANLRAQITLLAGNSKTLSESLTSAKTNLATTTAQLRQSSVELKKAQTATGGFASGVGKAFTGLRSLANLIPGLGIGGIFLVAIEAVRGFVDMLGKANKSQEALNISMAEAGASVAGEIANMRSLISIAKDTSLSYETRTQAINQLNKEYPELHGNLTLENINTQGVTNAIESQIEAIKRRAQAKALEQLINKETEKLNIAEAERVVKVGKEIKRQRSDFQKGANELAKFLGAPGMFAERSDAADHYNEIIAESTEKIDLFTKKLNELNITGAKQGTLFIDPAKAAKPIKALETVNDVLAKMRANLVVIEKNEDFFNIDKSLEKIKLVQSTVTKLFEQFKLATTDPHILKLDFEFGVAERGEIRKELSKIVPKEVAVPVALTLAPASAVLPVFRDLTSQVLPEVEKFSKDVNNILNNMNADILSGIGESIGNALTGQGDFAKEIFGSIFQTLGAALQQLGKVAIEVGIGIKAIKTAFKSLNPIVAIAAGIGMIALGTLIKNSVGKIGAFAQGGLIQGPGTSKSDSILARLSKGEFIIKADTVAKFGTSFFEMLNRGFMPRGMNTGGSVGSSSIGGGQFIEIGGEFELRGNKLVAAVQRAQGSISRNG